MGLSVLEYWSSGRGLEATRGKNDFPEGDAFKRYFTDTLFGQDLVDFGCGLGRMAELFSKRRYIGVDICQRAISKALETMPGYEFHLIVPDGSPIEWGYALLANHVLVHVPDEQLSETIGRFTQRRVLVCEHTLDNLRKAGLEAQIGDMATVRQVEAYDRAFTPHGYTLHRIQYQKWGKMPEHTVMEFHRN
jgi:SAM-dependent methyltransferase